MCCSSQNMGAWTLFDGPYPRSFGRREPAPEPLFRRASRWRFGILFSPSPFAGEFSLVCALENLHMVSYSHIVNIVLCIVYSHIVYSHIGVLCYIDCVSCQGCKGFKNLLQNAGFSRWMGPFGPEVAWSITTQLHLLAFLAGRLVEGRGLYQPIGKPLFAGENDGLKSTHCSNLPIVPSPFSPENDQQFARCSRRVGTRGFPCGLRISTAKRRSFNANRHLELRSLAATEVGWDPLNATINMNGEQWIVRNCLDEW